MKISNKYYRFFLGTFLLLFAVNINMLYAQNVYSKEDLTAINFKVDSIKKEIIQIESNYENIQNKLFDDSVLLAQLNLQVAQKRVEYQNKLKGQKTNIQDNKNEIEQLKKINNNYEKENTAKQVIIQKLNKQIQNIKPQTESLNRLKLDSVNLVKTISELQNQLENNTINYDDSIEKVKKIVIQQKKYLYTIYENQLTIVNTSSLVEKTEADKLLAFKNQLVSLGLEETKLSPPIFFENYYKLIVMANEQLSKPCNKKEIDLINSELSKFKSDKNISESQQKSIEYYNDLLTNYSSVVSFFANEFSSTTPLYNWFGKTADAYRKQALKKMKDLEEKEETKKYPIILPELTRLKQLLDKKDGAANNNFKCN
jgi:hypothetical protein